MDKIVITGATGFLGRNLADKFLSRGDLVYALVRPESKNLDCLPVHRNLKLIRCSLEQVLDCVEQIKTADAFFHFAWGGVNREEIDSPQVQAENVKGSMDCIKAAHLLKCKVFADAGSRVEYGLTDQIMTEDLPCHPVNEYGRAKLEFYRQAESLCMEYELKYAHLRFFSVYGYGDHPWSVISTLVREFGRDKEVPLSLCEHRWNFMYIEDAVEAVYRLYDRMKQGAWGKALAVNIAGEDTRRLKEFVEEIQSITGGGGIPRFGSFDQGKEKALSVCPGTKRLKDLTGFVEKYSFHDGITQMIQKEVEQNDEKN